MSHPTEEKGLRKAYNALRRAKKKWRTAGRLGVTAADHLAVGSSPPVQLEKNPGKTLAGIMSTEEIAAWLEQKATFLSSEKKRYAAMENPDDWTKSGLVLYAKAELRLAIPYLASIGKLPQEFTDFHVEDLESDPQ